jgi:hypothetical protein
MSTTTQQNYKPVAYARPNWREREALKEKQQREAAQKYADEMQRKQYENTEQNFPTTMTAAKRKAEGAPQGFSNLAKKWRQDDELEQKLEAYRKSKTEMERRALLSSIYVLRNRRAGDDEEDLYEDEVETLPPQEEDLNEKFPPHGRRGTYTEPDEEGWRTVVRRVRKQKHTLTEAELAQKYRETFFEKEDENESGDYVDDAGAHRRDFW